MTANVMPTAATAKPRCQLISSPRWPVISAGEERAEVDAQVEDREAGVAFRVVLRVQVADHRRHVGLEQAGTENDQRHAGEDTPAGGDRHDVVAAGDHDAADQNGPPGADQAVGDPPAGHRHQVDHRVVDAVDRVRATLGDAQARVVAGDRRCQIEDQDGPHAVEAETLPHLGEEEGREGPRMTEEPGVVTGFTCGRGVGDGHRGLPVPSRLLGRIT